MFFFFYWESRSPGTGRGQGPICARDAHHNVPGIDRIDYGTPIVIDLNLAKFFPLASGIFREETKRSSWLGRQVRRFSNVKGF